MRHRAPDEDNQGGYDSEETNPNLRALDPVKFGYRQNQIKDEELNRLIDEYRENM